jgi:hypothetical protein
MLMKNSNKTIGNRTRNLPVCSALPQPTAQPRTPIKIGKYKNLNIVLFKLFNIEQFQVKLRSCL